MITTWTDSGMNWTTPDSSKVEYWEAVRRAWAERLQALQMYDMQLGTRRDILGSPRGWSVYNTLFKYLFAGQLFATSGYFNQRWLDHHTCNISGFSDTDGYLVFGWKPWTLLSHLGYSGSASAAAMGCYADEANKRINDNWLKFQYNIINELLWRTDFVFSAGIRRYGSGSGTTYAEALSNAWTNYNGRAWAAYTTTTTQFYSSCLANEDLDYFSINLEAQILRPYMTSPHGYKGVQTSAQMAFKFTRMIGYDSSTYYHPGGATEDVWTTYDVAETDGYYIPHDFIFPVQDPPNPPYPNAGETAVSGFRTILPTLGWNGLLKMNGTNGFKFK